MALDEADEKLRTAETRAGTEDEEGEEEEEARRSRRAAISDDEGDDSEQRKRARASGDTTETVDAGDDVATIRENVLSTRCMQLARPSEDLRGLGAEFEELGRGKTCSSAGPEQTRSGNWRYRKRSRTLDMQSYQVHTARDKLAGQDMQDAVTRMSAGDQKASGR